MLKRGVISNNQLANALGFFPSSGFILCFKAADLDYMATRPFQLMLLFTPRKVLGDALVNNSVADLEIISIPISFPDHNTPPLLRIILLKQVMSASKEWDYDIFDNYNDEYYGNKDGYYP
ncbi:hypothetical protein ES703_06642 [subsurface metagenome]